MLEKQSAILRTTFLFWLLAKLISYKVWLAERFYLLVPPFGFLDNLPSEVHLGLFISSLLLLVFLLVFPKNRTLLFFLLGIEILACSLDITRWQPWEYQYLFIIFIFLINRKDKKGFFTALIFLLSLIYIFSGLHKFNGAYLYATWGRMILSGFLNISSEMIKNHFIHYLGLLLPLIEIGGGLALLILKNKKTPALVLMTMHFFILILIGPLGSDYNMVVWPWNVAMIFLLYFLFFKNSKSFSPKYILRGANPIILVFWALLPLFNFVGYWDLYLYSALYSGKEIRLDVCFSETKKTAGLLPFTSEKDGIVNCDHDARLPLFQWTFDEMNVPPYPALWYYKKFKKEWMEEYGEADFILYSYPYAENTIMK